MGITVTDLGLATTPTVELAVAGTGAAGGIIVTASHNPSQWNALKLLNEKGEFLSAKDGEEVLKLASDENFEFVQAGYEGELFSDQSWGQKHIDMILKLDLVDQVSNRKSRIQGCSGLYKFGRWYNYPAASEGSWCEISY